MQGGFDFGTERQHHRRPSLTPMVDVVFLLLVFFMLAARFGLDRAIPLTPPGPSVGAYQGAPRLVTVTPDAVLLNGVAVPEGELAAALAPLMPDPEATVILRSAETARLQRLVAVLDRLGAAGYTNLVLAE